MDNKSFLEQAKKQYESLTFFEFKNNTLILNLDKKYFIPLIHVNLSVLNLNIFLLEPKKIFDICCMLELLNFQELSENQKQFVEYYTNKYLIINDQALENQEIDQNLHYQLSIPINYAYDTRFENMPLSQIVRDIINSHIENQKNGHGNKYSKSLKKAGLPNTIGYDIESDMKKAGFSSITLIIIAIIITISYLLYFYLSK